HQVRSHQPDERRRQLLAWAAAGAAGIALPAPAYARKEKLRTSARIVIAGAGAAGLATASRLAAALEGATITLIDTKVQHWYQPGFTLVGSGVKPSHYVVSNTAEYVPSSVEWLQQSVAEID